MVRKVAGPSPFTFSQLANLAVGLESIGLETNALLPRLANLGAAFGADEEHLKSLLNMVGKFKVGQMPDAEQMAAHLERHPRHDPGRLPDLRRVRDPSRRLHRVLSFRRHAGRQSRAHDRADDRFLVLEVVIDVAGAHAGDLRDLRDAGAMKAVLAKALRRGGEDLLAAGGSARRFGGVGRGVRDLHVVPV